MRLFFGRGARTLLFFAALGCIAGCSGDIKDYCEDLAACEGLSSADQDACVEFLKGDRKIADDYGCRDEFDAYYGCYVEYGQCEYDSMYGENSYVYGNDETGLSACDAEETAYYGCGGVESLW